MERTLPVHPSRRAARGWSSACWCWRSSWRAARRPKRSSIRCSSSSGPCRRRTSTTYRDAHPDGGRHVAAHAVRRQRQPTTIRSTTPSATRGTRRWPCQATRHEILPRLQDFPVHGQRLAEVRGVHDRRLGLQHERRSGRPSTPRAGWASPRPPSSRRSARTRSPRRFGLVTMRQGSTPVDRVGQRRPGPGRRHRAVDAERHGPARILEGDARPLVGRVAERQLERRGADAGREGPGRLVDSEYRHRHDPEQDVHDERCDSAGR